MDGEGSLVQGAFLLFNMLPPEIERCRKEQQEAVCYYEKESSCLRAIWVQDWVKEELLIEEEKQMTFMSGTIPIENIEIPPNRFRRDFSPEKLEELVISIGKIGLLHPIIVRESPTQEGRYFLVAGERRFRAVKSILAMGLPITYMGGPVPLGNIPAAKYEEVKDSLFVKEIELQENAIRADLTWQEHAQAVASLHELRTMSDPSHSMTDTAEEITGRRDNTTVVRDEILLAQNLARPEIAKARTKADAMKILKSSIIEDFNRALGNVVKLDTQDMVVELLPLELSLSTQTQRFDVILTDPPYGIDADKFDMEIASESEKSVNGLQVINHNYRDDWPTAKRLYTLLASGGFAITKPQAHLYAFCDLSHFFELKDIFSSAGWHVWPRPIIWVKDVGSLGDPQHGPRHMYEVILFANKGNKPVTALYNDVIICPAVKNKDHAAQKPVDLYVNLLRRSCVPGDLVYDPFCGSGPIFPAAHQLQLKACGSDNDPNFVGLCRKLISELGKGKI